MKKQLPKCIAKLLRRQPEEIKPYVEKPLTTEIVMAALARKDMVIQISKPLRRTESDIDKINRQVNRLLYYR